MSARQDVGSRFTILLKSYAADFDYAERLVHSFCAHNPTGLTLTCVVPERDIARFTSLTSETVTVMSETPFEHHFTDTPVSGIRPGYINQEIVKLAFWELGTADAYFCVDSDAVFIRDLSITDFLAPDGHPYTVLVEDRELMVEPRYYEEYWISREEALRRIANVMELADPVLRTCHGHQIFSSTVLASFVTDFLNPRGWTYLDALRMAPYEFSWYNFWLQKDTTIPIHVREPLVKVFHHEDQHLEYIMRGITQADIARGYVGYVVNSNYSRDLGLMNPHATKPEALGPYLSYREVASLVAAKTRASLRRLTQR